MLSKRLKELLNEKQISLDYYAQMSGVPMETLRNIYYGRTSNPNIKTVMAMAEALDMSINALLGVENATNKEEQQLIRDFRLLGKKGRMRLLVLAENEVRRQKSKNEEIGKYSVPYLSFPRDKCINGLSEIVAEDTIITDKKEAYLAFQTNINDNIPTYCKGDILLLENRFPRVGEHGVFLYESQIMIRIFKEDEDGYHLDTIHKIGKNISMKRLDKVECIGTCCGVIEC